jgi:type IV pilus assembly protein PilP
MFMALTGCAQQGAEPSVALAMEESQPTPPAVATTSLPSADDDYAYNPIGKRDPYRAFFPTGPGGIGVDCLETGDPLQCFAVEQLQLTGVVWGERPRALLEDPGGGSHVVELGSYVGKQWGRVTHIESDAVVITEEYLGRDDQLVTHPIRLKLGPTG